MRVRRDLVVILFRAASGSAITLLVVQGVMSMLPAATSVTVGRVVDAAQRSLGGSSNTAPLTTALVVFALVFGLGAILSPVADVANPPIAAVSAR